MTDVMTSSVMVIDNNISTIDNGGSKNNNTVENNSLNVAGDIKNVTNNNINDDDILLHPLFIDSLPTHYTSNIGLSAITALLAEDELSNKHCIRTNDKKTASLNTRSNRRLKHSKPYKKSSKINGVINKKLQSQLQHQYSSDDTINNAKNGSDNNDIIVNNDNESSDSDVVQQAYATSEATLFMKLWKI